MTRGDRFPVQAIDMVMQVIIDADEILQHGSVKKSDGLQLKIRRLRRHAEQANTAICRAWFADEMVPPDDPGKGNVVPLKAA